MGNPPFVGARLMGKEQKADVNTIFPGWKNAGNLDYVCCWYKRLPILCREHRFARRWFRQILYRRGRALPTFGNRCLMTVCILILPIARSAGTARAKIKAHVHCVIIGFSVAASSTPKSCLMVTATKWRII